jgi:hypothetical protein
MSRSPRVGDQPSLSVVEESGSGRARPARRARRVLASSARGLGVLRERLRTRAASRPSSSPRAIARKETATKRTTSIGTARGRSTRNTSATAEERHAAVRARARNERRRCIGARGRAGSGPEDGEEGTTGAGAAARRATRAGVASARCERRRRAKARGRRGQTGLLDGATRSNPRSGREPASGRPPRRNSRARIPGHGGRVHRCRGPRL